MQFQSSLANEGQCEIPNKQERHRRELCILEECKPVLDRVLIHSEEFWWLFTPCGTMRSESSLPAKQLGKNGSSTKKNDYGN